MKDNKNPKLESLKNWETPKPELIKKVRSRSFIEMGWGRLIFAHTFSSQEELLNELFQQQEDKRDIAFYAWDPHVIQAIAPQRVFIDPSHTFRIQLQKYKADSKGALGFKVRRLKSENDIDEMNRIFLKRNMVPVDKEYVWSKRSSRTLIYLVAEDETGQVIGTVTGVDHEKAFGDTEKGSSLWCLAVDTTTASPGVGEAMVRWLLDYFQKGQKTFLDLSVMHDNSRATSLYRKLGFERVPVFCLKVKNAFNEPLYTNPDFQPHLNPYAEIIIREAHRRGIHSEILDIEKNIFLLSLGGRRVICHESLTELTSSIAMTRCQDKSLTRRVLAKSAIEVPAQITHKEINESTQFLNRYKRIVVKPANGEQGRGVFVDIRTKEDLSKAVKQLEKEHIIIEEFVEGEDLRIIVIDNAVIAAAVRRPPRVIGTGINTVEELIQSLNRRRMADTGGESSVPVDNETLRCIGEQGYKLDQKPEEGVELILRKTANLHAGGTIHDVTDSLHPNLIDAAIKAAIALEIPVVGFDFMVKSPTLPDYKIIEANERPGLANHEPQPTAERFIDFLFPQTVEQNLELESQR